jgi:hypothetical protein
MTHVDLTETEGAPSARANVNDLPVEADEVRLWLRLGGGEIEFTARGQRGTLMAAALPYLPPTIAGVMLAAVLEVIGAPIWLVCCVLLTPFACWAVRRN